MFKLKVQLIQIQFVKVKTLAQSLLFAIEQGSQTQIHRRATFQRKSIQRAAVYYKKLLRAAI